MNEWMNKFGKCFTIKFRNDLIFRRWCECVWAVCCVLYNRIFSCISFLSMYTSFNITEWYMAVFHNMYVCIHHPFICNSNCWKHLISLACFMTFLTWKWQHSYMHALAHTQVEITHHCVIFWSLWPLTLGYLLWVYMTNFRQINGSVII